MHAWPNNSKIDNRGSKLLSSLVNLSFVKQEVVNNLLDELKPLPAEPEMVDYLIKHLIANRDQINQAYAKMLHLPFLELPDEIDKEAIKNIPLKVCQEKNIVVYKVANEDWYVATAKPEFLQSGQSGVISQMAKSPKSKHILSITSLKSIQKWLEKYPQKETEGSVSFKETSPNTTVTPLKPTSVVLLNRKIDPGILRKIPIVIARSINLVAYQQSEKNLFQVAAINPEDTKVKEAVKYIETNNNVRLVVHQSSQNDIEYALSCYDLKDRIFAPKTCRNLSVEQELLQKIPYNVAKKHRIIAINRIKSFSPDSHDVYQIVSDKIDQDTFRIGQFIENHNNVILHLFPTKSEDVDHLLSLYPESRSSETLSLPNAAKAQWLLPEPPKNEPLKKNIVPIPPASSVEKTLPAKQVPAPGSDNSFFAANEKNDQPESFWPKWIRDIFGMDKPKERVVSEMVVTPGGVIPVNENGATTNSANFASVLKKDESVVAQKPPINLTPREANKPAVDPQKSVAPGSQINSDIAKPEGDDKEKKKFNEDEDNLGDLLDHDISSLEELQKLIQEGFVPREVAALVSFAITRHASDIHIEAETNDVRVRYRIDGMLQDITRLPMEQHAAIVSRIKILSKLKIDETRIPQDGRFDVNFKNRSVDLRVSSMPTVHGEKIVMRILDKTHGIMSLEDLGVLGRAFDIIIEAIKKPYGIVLSTGPTGSGKSTTLYAILNRISVPTVNVITLEDPVEYEIAGVNQAQIKPKIGFTFAEGLRSVLRQDPNIVMVGEIRDAETASMATHAALTGHLVLSTLHTNDAPGALPRLINMGIEPFLITSSINAVEAQRLVRRICPNCKEEVELPETVVKEVTDELNKIPQNNPKDRARITNPMKFYHGKGCEKCQNGYHGRIGIYEVMPMSEQIEQLAINKSPAAEIQVQAIKEGMITMKQDGLLKALTGMTTVDEVMRETSE